MNAHLLHLTDFHFWKVLLNPLRMLNKRALGNVNVVLRRRREFVIHQADNVAAHVAGLGARDVFLGGDFTSTALPEEFAAAVRWANGLAARGLRVSVVPGNHDVYTFESVRKRRFELAFADYIPQEGYPCVRRLEGGVPLVLAPTVCANRVSSRGRISRSELDKTCALVSACPEELVLVGAHYPVLETTPWYNTPESRRLREAAAFRHALGETGKRVLYLCGHAHRFGYIQDHDHANLSHLCTGALFLNKHTAPESGTFSEIRVDNGEVRVYLHKLMGQWQREEVQARSY